MSQITQLASRLFSPSGFSPVKTLPTTKRVRGILNGQTIFDTISPLMVWETYSPQYWIPRSDFLDNGAKGSSNSVVRFEKDKPISGIDSSTYSISTQAGQKSITVLVVPEAFNSPLAGLVKIEFKALDAWYEEQTLMLYPPKDPGHRVDCLPSGRHVKVTLDDGTVLADTGSEGGVMSLWETNFPGRWYLPGTAVNFSHLTPSDTKTGCPYKGEASYHSYVSSSSANEEVKDIVWHYKTPTVESALVTGMYCFYPDKVRTFIDGVEIDLKGRPKGTVEKVMVAQENGHANGGENKEKGEEGKNTGYEKSCNC